MEIFKDVIGYEGFYKVSNIGRVMGISYKGKKILSPNKTKNGYMNVILCVNQVKTHKNIHRLVAEAFLENNDNLAVVNHKDCNKENNSVDNLEWCSVEYNNEHSKLNKRLQRYEDRPFSKLTKESVLAIPSLIENGATTDDLANLFSVSRRCIDNIFCGYNWTGLGIDFTKIKPNKKIKGTPSKFQVNRMGNTVLN